MKKRGSRIWINDMKYIYFIYGFIWYLVHLCLAFVARQFLPITDERPEQDRELARKIFFSQAQALAAQMERKGSIEIWIFLPPILPSEQTSQQEMEIVVRTFH